MVLSEANTINSIKRSSKAGFWRKNMSLGENMGKPTIKPTESTIVAKMTSVKPVLILSFLRSEVGRKRINAVFRPSMENPTIKEVTEISVVAKPICSLV